MKKSKYKFSLIISIFTLLILKSYYSSAQFQSVFNLSEITTNTGQKINGERREDWSGYSISNVGDFNNDNFDDIVISAKFNNTPGNFSDAGTVYVVYGGINSNLNNINLSELTAGSGLFVYGQHSFENMGGSISSAGDLNGDGINDIIIGSSEYSNNDQSYVGSAYIIFGRDNYSPNSINVSELDGVNGFSISGLENYERLGSSVSNIGDVNVDGVDDILIASTQFNRESYTSKCYVLFGKKTGFNANVDINNLNGDNGFVVVKEWPDNHSGGYKGICVSSDYIGDFNKDGIDDILISSTDNQAYIIYGKRNFDATFNLKNIHSFIGYVIKGKDGDYITDFVSSAGDFNNDGTNDIILTNSSNAYIVFGRSAFLEESFTVSNINGFNGTKITIAESYFNPRAISKAGDINGDGYDDIIISGNSDGFKSDSSIRNSAYVVYGFRNQINSELSIEDINGENGFNIRGIDPEVTVGDTNAFDVSNAGDYNADGVDDFLVSVLHGSPEGKLNAGITFVVYGNDTIFKQNFDQNE